MSIFVENIFNLLYNEFVDRISLNNKIVGEKNMKEEVSNNQEEAKIAKKKHRLLKTILIIFILFLLLVILATSSCYVFLLKNKERITNCNTQAIIKEEKIVEYGSSLTYEEILENIVTTANLTENTTVKLWLNDTVFEKEQYVFNTVGNITMTIETSTPIFQTLSQFLNKEVVITEQIIWKVQDTKKPVLSGVQDREITQGEEIDIKAGITAKDEVDGDLEVTIEGEFDINTVGEYILTAKAVDKNQNEVTETFKLTVKEKQIQVTKPSTTGSNKNSSSSGSSSSSSSSSSSNSNSNSSSSSSPNASTKEGRLALAKVEAKRVVSQIITSGMTNLQKATAICNYITTTVDVQTNQSSEAYKTNYGNEAYAALIMKIAACSGRCKAVTLLCDAAGLKSQHINQNQWTHQWNKIQMEDGSWVVVDAQIGLVADKHPLE